MSIHRWLVVVCGAVACNDAAVRPLDLEFTRLERASSSEASLARDAAPSQPMTPAEREAAVRDDLAARWSGEVPDPLWRSARELELRSALVGPAFPPTEIAALDCRATLCRLVVAHREPLERDAFVDAMSASSAFRQEFFGYFPGAEAQRDTEFFVARDGFALAGGALPR